MSIQQAIEKARELAKNRRETDQAQYPASPVDQAVQAPTRQRAPSTPREFKPLGFRQLEFDPVLCAENRITMLGERGEHENARAEAAYRMLRARVLQRTRANKWTTIGITSPGPGAGKSVTALNLALSIAREKNNSVFLLDLDMRNPSICKHLGLTPERELIDYFEMGIPLEKVFFSVGTDNLAIAGSLRPTNQASELLSTARLPELLDYVQQAAPSPLVIIDLPPVLSTDDAMVVAPHLDASFIVVAEGRTRRDSLHRTREALADFNVAGVILNCSREAVGDYYSTAY
jgi:protein-tyrosine kinase